MLNGKARIPQASQQRAVSAENAKHREDATPTTTNTTTTWWAMIARNWRQTNMVNFSRTSRIAVAENVLRGAQHTYTDKLYVCLLLIAPLSDDGRDGGVWGEVDLRFVRKKKNTLHWITTQMVGWVDRRRGGIDGLCAPEFGIYTKGVPMMLIYTINTFSQ